MFNSVINSVIADGYATESKGDFYLFCRRVRKTPEGENIDEGFYVPLEVPSAMAELILARIDDEKERSGLYFVKARIVGTLGIVKGTNTGIRVEHLEFGLPMTEGEAASVRIASKEVSV